MHPNNLNQNQRKSNISPRGIRNSRNSKYSNQRESLTSFATNMDDEIYQEYYRHSMISRKSKYKSNNKIQTNNTKNSKLETMNAMMIDETNANNRTKKSTFARFFHKTGKNSNASDNFSDKSGNYKVSTDSQTENILKNNSIENYYSSLDSSDMSHIKGTQAKAKSSELIEMNRKDDFKSKPHSFAAPLTTGSKQTDASPRLNSKTPASRYDSNIKKYNKHRSKKNIGSIISSYYRNRRKRFRFLNKSIILLFLCLFLLTAFFVACGIELFYKCVVDANKDPQFVLKHEFGVNFWECEYDASDIYQVCWLQCNIFLFVCLFVCNNININIQNIVYRSQLFAVCNNMFVFDINLFGISCKTFNIFGL